MIQKVCAPWNERYQHDGFLFFAQRIVEMLDFVTVDIYRAPLQNTTRLIDEYLRISRSASRPYHLEEVYNEFLDSFDNDIVIQQHWCSDRMLQIRAMLRLPENRNKTMEYLHDVVGESYLDWVIKYIRHIVPQNREKKKIERAIRCFLPELFRQGYSRDDIYHSAKDLLNDSTNPETALDEFLNQFDLRKKTYCVYFGISKRLAASRDILSSRLSISFNDDGNFSKLVTLPDYCIAKTREIAALDASSAARIALRDIEHFTSFFQYFGNYGEDLLQPKALVISADGTERKLPINRAKYASLENSDRMRIGMLSEIIVTNLLSSARSDYPKLKKIAQLHNSAISTNGLENGFVNLWSILEVICVENPESSKIEQVKNTVVPILQRTYLTTAFEDMANNLREILGAESFKSLLDSITTGANDFEKIACFVLLRDYSQCFDSFVDNLVEYPVLRSRMLLLHDNYSTKHDLLNLTSRYAQRISWHIYRIYRARNEIVHSGKRPANLKDLGEHLHAYVDRVVNEILIKLGTTHIQSISNALVDSKLQYTEFENRFRGDGSLDENDIHYVVSELFWGET